MEECGAADAAAEKSEPGRRNAGLAFAMVDRLYRLLGDSDASREELRSMLRLLACSTKAAEIPPVLDCVTVCDAARSIPFNPRAMFVMGLNDGVFPKDDFSGLLFTLEERDLLLENEIRLAGCFDRTILIQGGTDQRRV
jgi:ATP-dependent helicase/nuclease subunit B